MTKLIYIISAGHSGSTLLDLVVGTLPQTFSMGEVRRLPWQLNNKDMAVASLQNQNICSCMQPFDQCPAWTDIIASLSKKKGYDIFQNPAKLNISMLIGHAANRKVGVLNRVLNKAYKYSLSDSSFNFIINLINKTQEEIIRNNWDLFDSIGSEMNIDFVIDSSKDISRFFFLQSYRPQETYLLINKRDPIRYANSYLKLGTPPEQSLVARHHFYQMVDKMLVNKPDIKAMEVNYEDLCDEPATIRKKIADFVGITHVNEFPEMLDTKKYHLVEGNPMRYKGEMKIRRDDKWKTELSPEDLDKVYTLISQIEDKPFEIPQIP